MGLVIAALQATVLLGVDDVIVLAATAPARVVGVTVGVELEAYHVVRPDGGVLVALKEEGVALLRMAAAVVLVVAVAVGAATTIVAVVEVSHLEVVRCPAALRRVGAARLGQEEGRTPAIHAAEAPCAGDAVRPGLPAEAEAVAEADEPVLRAALVEIEGLGCRAISHYCFHHSMSSVPLGYPVPPTKVSILLNITMPIYLILQNNIF